MAFFVEVPGDRSSQAPRDGGGFRGARRSAIGFHRSLLIFAIILVSIAPGLVNSARAQTTCAPNAPQVIVYHADSLNALFSAVEQMFTRETGVCVTDVSAGSVDAARRVTAGGQPCDVFVSADYQVIDRFLKPAGYADYDLLFGKTADVLAYTTSSKGADTIARSGGNFAPPGSVPEVAKDWYEQLTQSGVAIGGTNPVLDPGGYRADFVFQLAEKVYRVPSLYNTLLQHYSINKPTDALGKTYDYGFAYEFSAQLAYQANPGAYRFARLPAPVGLSNSRLNPLYGQAALILPGLRTRGSAPFVEVNGSRVVFGLTILKTAPNPDNAVKFLQLFFSDPGVALQEQFGPTPISPPLVSGADMASLPQSLQSVASAGQ